MTPRIKKAYRHFNAFLVRHSCKQKFWRCIQLKANYEKVPYHIMKTKILACNRPQEWVLQGLMPLYIGSSFMCSMPWAKLHREWWDYVQNHNYFQV